MNSSTGTGPSREGRGYTYTTEERALLQEIAANTRVIAVKLFGSSDADEENETGRLPKVEREARRAHERIDLMERKLERWAGALACFLFLVTVIVPAVRHYLKF